MTTTKAVERTVDEVLKGVRRATQYLTPKYVVKATNQRQPNRRSRTQTILVTIGSPNYREREFIRAAKKAGEPFPIKKVQRQDWPKVKHAS